MTKSKHVAQPRVKEPVCPPPAKPALPRWVEASHLPTASLDEALLYALCGGKGERHLLDPRVALAERIAADAEALHEMLRERLGSTPVADMLQGFADRTVVLALILGRTL